MGEPTSAVKPVSGTSTRQSRITTVDPSPAQKITGRSQRLLPRTASSANKSLARLICEELPPKISTGSTKKTLLPLRVLVSEKEADAVWNRTPVPKLIYEESPKFALPKTFAKMAVGSAMKTTPMPAHKITGRSQRLPPRTASSATKSLARLICEELPPKISTGSTKKTPLPLRVLVSEKEADAMWKRTPVPKLIYEESPKFALPKTPAKMGSVVKLPQRVLVSETVGGRTAHKTTPMPLRVLVDENLSPNGTAFKTPLRILRSSGPGARSANGPKSIYENPVSKLTFEDSPQCNSFGGDEMRRWYSAGSAKKMTPLPQRVLVSGGGMTRGKLTSIADVDEKPEDDGSGDDKSKSDFTVSFNLPTAFPNDSIPPPTPGSSCLRRTPKNFGPIKTPAKNNPSKRIALSKQVRFDKSPTIFPASYAKGLAEHFSERKLTTEAQALFQKCTDKILRKIVDEVTQLAEDEDKTTITVSDIEELMSRKGLVTPNEPLEVLVESRLCLEYRKELIPMAKIDNQVTP